VKWIINIHRCTGTAADMCSDPVLSSRSVAALMTGKVNYPECVQDHFQNLIHFSILSKFDMVPNFCEDPLTAFLSYCITQMGVKTLSLPAYDASNYCDVQAEFAVLPVVYYHQNFMMHMLTVNLAFLLVTDRGIFSYCIHRIYLLLHCYCGGFIMLNKEQTCFVTVI